MMILRLPPLPGYTCILISRKATRRISFCFSLRREKPSFREMKFSAPRRLKLPSPFVMFITRAQLLEIIIVVVLLPPAVIHYILFIFFVINASKVSTCKCGLRL